MAPVLHTTKDENAFMADLLGGLDDSFWNAVPTPDSSPIKSSVPRQRTTPSKHQPQHFAATSRPKASATAPPPSKMLSAGDIDLTELLQGAENWDWDDDLLTPKKSPRKAAQVKWFIQILRAQGCLACFSPRCLKRHRTSLNHVLDV
jgi:DNA replication ATP-dependent helicase Dna2